MRHTSARKLRIAVDGAQSTGKTTIFDSLERSFRTSFTFIPEASRSIAPKFGVSRASDWPRLLSDADALRAFFNAEEEWQRSAEDRSNAFVVDSSLLLVQAYRQRFEPGYRLQETFANRYDLILYCPVAEEGISDGFRFLNGRAEVAYIYESIALKHFRGTFTRLPDGLARSHTAESYVRDLLQSDHPAGDSHD